ncbi:pentatricopeptide repeat-containing protein At3g22150, chloroplastic-like [Phragmites australis]|uniref:pentatricopeptide repeat-containing protein At3g22150, chloroplastic-like n=1 Tax=Phragmites australis TaxID=29695 RepID=UPI002D79889B|nr:pentatricopeptide repeat-containing protein At3g22150, chloroplastic-like [Phragmites australis]
MSPVHCAVSLPPALTNASASSAVDGGKKTHPTASQVRRLCKQGRLDRARRLLLEALPRPPPTLLCNVLLIAYVARALPDHALRLYALLNHAAYPPPRSDHYTYSSALTACARTGRLRLGRSIHAHLLRRARSLPDSAVLRNSLLNLYASCVRYRDGGVDVVRRQFDAMPKRNSVSWNTLFGWYVKTGRPHEALELFTRMLEDGVRPTPVSFVNVFPAVASDDPSWPFVLYGLLVKHGVDYVNDLFVVSSAIAMFSELGDVQSAWRVFERAAKKNTEVWNTMITGYVQNGKFSEAMDLFNQLLGSREVPLDVVTFLSALTAASQSQDGKLGQQLHGYLIKGMHGTLPVILGNALVVMYSRCGNVQTAFDLFDRLAEKDIVSWNTMVTAFVQNDFDLEGLLLVYQMQKSGFAADSVTLTAVLSAASNTGDLRIGKQAHGYLIRRGIEGEGLESYLIDMYAKSGRIEIAQRVFGDYGTDERDEVTWNAMIAGYTQSGQSEKAVLVFRAMLEAGLEPTSVTLASVLPACDPVGGGISAGKQIHCFAVRRCLDINVFVGTALVDMYSKCGEITSAEQVFGGMIEKSTISYTTMISGLGQHGFGRRALSLFYSMKEKGLKPDAVTFLAAISACNYSGLVEEGLALYRSMETFGLAATPQHHCCIVDMLGKAGRVEEAYDFVEELGDQSNFVSIWGSLLASCKAQGKQELAKLVTERLLCIEKKYGHAGYNVLLSHIFSAESNWSSADSLRKEMRLRGLRKVAGSSWIRVQDAALQNYPKNGQIYSMLQGVNHSSDEII